MTFWNTFLFDKIFQISTKLWLKYIPQNLIENMSALIQIMALHFATMSSKHDHVHWHIKSHCIFAKTGPIFCLLLGVSSDYAQPITGQVTEVTCPVIGWAQPELTPSKRQKTGPDLCKQFVYDVWYALLQAKCKHCMYNTFNGAKFQMLSCKQWIHYSSRNSTYMCTAQTEKLFLSDNLMFVYYFATLDINISVFLGNTIHYESEKVHLSKEAYNLFFPQEIIP